MVRLLWLLLLIANERVVIKIKIKMINYALELCRWLVPNMCVVAMEELRAPVSCDAKNMEKQALAMGLAEDVEWNR